MGSPKIDDLTAATVCIPDLPSHACFENPAAIDHVSLVEENLEELVGEVIVRLDVRSSSVTQDQHVPPRQGTIP